MDNEALPRETEISVELPGSPRLDQYKKYPKDGIIQTVTMKELVSSLNL